MSWTPHTTSELQKAGVQFGVGDNVTNPVPVIVGNNPVAAMAASGTPISVNTGNAAKGISSINANVGNALGSVGAAAGLDPVGLEDLIMANTDKNNAWSAAQAQKQMDFQERMQQIAQEFNSSEAAKNRDWQEMMSNTAHQREVADLKAAGLNPILSASGGNGAAVGSGASANVGVPSGAQGNGDQSGNSALVAIYSALINAQTQMANANLSAKTNLAMAEMQTEAQMYGSALAAEASKYGSSMNYAAAQYSADNNYRMQQADLDFKDSHPSSIVQAAGSAGLVSDVKSGYQGFMNDARKAVRNLFGLSTGPSGKSVSSRSY